MSESTTLEETSATDGEALPELVESEHLGADAPADETPLKTRALLPLLVPLLSIAIVAVLVLNISRVFLAGDKDAALAMAIVITLAILVGASLIAAAPRMSTASTALVLGLVLVGVSIAGFVSLGASLDDSEGGPSGYVQPTGKAGSTVDVEALASINFNSHQFSAKAGIVQFNYSGATGHTLAIQDPKFDGFLLTTDAGGPKTGKVELSPGSYIIYCTVPGHEAQGMKATVTVTK
jgi:plastocyanin